MVWLSAETRFTSELYCFVVSLILLDALDIIVRPSRVSGGKFVLLHDILYFPPVSSSLRRLENALNFLFRVFVCGELLLNDSSRKPTAKFVQFEKFEYIDIVLW